MAAVDEMNPRGEPTPLSASATTGIDAGPAVMLRCLGPDGTFSFGPGSDDFVAWAFPPGPIDLTVPYGLHYKFGVVPPVGEQCRIFREPLKSQTTLDAARRELAGEETGFDHVTKVRNAQQGLTNRIEAIRRQLGQPGLADAERRALQEEMGEASRLLDHSEAFVPR